MFDWGLGAYSLGAFVSWLFVGILSENWDKAAVLGAAVALIGVLLMFFEYVFESAMGASLLALILGSFPVGIISQVNYDGRSGMVGDSGNGGHRSGDRWARRAGDESQEEVGHLLIRGLFDTPWRRAPMRDSMG